MTVRLAVWPTVSDYSMNSVMKPYINELHNALMQKTDRFSGNAGSRNLPLQVVVLKSMAALTQWLLLTNLATIFSNNDRTQAENLKGEFCKLRKGYRGLPVLCDRDFDTELVTKVLTKLKRGKAADVFGLSAEHLIFSHPSLSVVLARLFRFILLSGYMPRGFKISYIVPIPKPKEFLSKSLSYDDIRGIAISPTISKGFECCFLDRFGSLLSSSDNQFGFKKTPVVGMRYTLFVRSSTAMLLEVQLPTFVQSIHLRLLMK